MTISFGGLASGINTSSIVAAMVQADSVPLVQLQSEQAADTSAQTDLSSFMSTVSSLGDASAALSDPQSFSSFDASSSAAGVSASIIGDASPGSFAVQVTQLATEQRTLSDPQATSTDALSQSGTLGIQVGDGTPVSVDVTPDDSLTSIAAKISSSGAGVSASVTYDGSQYHLLVRGSNTGASNAITFTEDGTSLGLSTPANTYQQASDAKLTVDGQPVTSPNNVVTGAIPGVTLNLSGTSDTPGTVTVASDTSALETKINTFVTAYNAVVSSSHFTAGYGTVTAESPLLQGDSSVRETMDQLTSIVNGAIPGTSGDYTTLDSVGISANDDGTLTFDDTKLEAALAADPSGVAKIFTTDPTNGSTGVMGTLDTAITSLTVGSNAALQARSDELGQDATQLGTEITDMQARITTYQTALQAQYAALEVTMSKIQIETSSLDSLTGTSSTSNSSASNAMATSLASPNISTPSSSTGGSSSSGSSSTSSFGNL